MAEAFSASGGEIYDRHVWARGFLPEPEAFGATDGRRSLLYGLVPFILGIHVAVPLLVNGVQGTLFSPDNEMPGAWANLLSLAEAGIALALFRRNPFCGFRL